MITSEIYFTKDYVTKAEWLEFIKIISTYNGYLKKWQIIIQNNNNCLRYFIKTKYELPSTINQLTSFIIKSTDPLPDIKTSVKSIYLANLHTNIIDLINYFEIKKKNRLVTIEITLLKIGEDKILSNNSFYLNKNNSIKKYKLLYSLPTNLLSIDFANNKRFMYKKVPKYLEINKILPILTKDQDKALFFIDPFPYRTNPLYLNQKAFSFNHHSLIIGSSGSGKSKLISLLINNIATIPDLKKKYKIVLLDPHASLEEDIGGLGKVIDFKTYESSLNLFSNNDTNELILASIENLLDLMKSLFAEQYNLKVERVLRYSFYLLLYNKLFTFQNLKKLLLDLEYRNFLIKQSKNNLPMSIINFFLLDFNDLKTTSYNEAISPIISFVEEMEMIPTFNYNYEENLQNTMQNNFLTIFSLDRAKLGIKVVKTISGLVMQQLLNIIQTYQLKEHIIFIIDEVPAIENLILAKFLAEARKYNLSLYLAGQYFSQFSNNLQNAIFANVINYFIFRVSKVDATILGENLEINIPFYNTKEEKIKLLTNLNNRECLIRLEQNNKLLPVFKGTTINFQSQSRKKAFSPLQLNKTSQPKVNSSFTIDNNLSQSTILKNISTNKKEG